MVSSDRFGFTSQPAGREESVPFSHLEERYRAYRRRQAELLPTVIPREGLRPLYRAAREWALDMGVPTGKDPLALLHQFCEESLLPLPTFEEWWGSGAMEDLGPSSLEDALQGAIPLAESVLVAVRDFQHADASWTAGLTVRRRPTGWTGHIAFADGSGGTARSADIFVENELREVHDRFDSLEQPTLSALLRSALP